MDDAVRELTISVEKALEPPPGALPLILDAVKVDKVRNDVVILDMTIVEPNSVEPVNVDTVMVLPLNVEYIAVRAVILEVTLRVLPVRVDTLIMFAFMLAKFEDRWVK